MNVNTLKAVEELKKLLAEEGAVKEYLEARDAYVADKELITLANEYNVQRSVYETEFAKEDKDELLLTSISARLDTLYEQITSNEVSKRFMAAEEAVNVLYNDVVNNLQSIVVPEHDHEHCSGNCASCGGCH